MANFIDYLLTFGSLTKSQIELIESKASEMELRKDQYFVEAGKLFTQVGFVVEGVLRICYYNNQGEEITKYFGSEQSFLANPYNIHEPLTEYIQAVTDCRLMVFSRADWEELSYSIHNWDDIVSKIFQKALMEKMDRRSAMISEDATTRYLSFLEHFPSLANRIPLSYIASYLGITQSSLSRIRKNKV